jgi:hypothetical protein
MIPRERFARTASTAEKAHPLTAAFIHSDISPAVVETEVHMEKAKNEPQRHRERRAVPGLPGGAFGRHSRPGAAEKQLLNRISCPFCKAFPPLPGVNGATRSVGPRA